MKDRSDNGEHEVYYRDMRVSNSRILTLWPSGTLNSALRQINPYFSEELGASLPRSDQIHPKFWYVLINIEEVT
jgi:hypothetical protein